MKLAVEIVVGISLIHKNTGKEFNLDKCIKQEYDEDSEKYKELVEIYTERIGFERTENKDKFDKELLSIITVDAKKEVMETIDNIMKVVKDVYREGKHGWIEFGGYVLNIEDFSGVCINKFESNFSKH